MTEGSSTNLRWLVKFDGQAYKDEELYEQGFGKLLHSAEEADDNQFGATNTKTLATGSNNKSSKRGAVSGTSSEGEKSDSSSSKKSKPKKTKKKVVVAAQLEEKADDGTDSNHGGGDEDLSDASGESAGRSKADKASAREARSKRRQAKIDEEMPVDFSTQGGKRKVGGTYLPSSKKLKGNTFDGEVTKVKMMTGTLFFYRGPSQRRVEFVPRV